MAETHVKALLFDLGKVLVPFDFTRAYRLLEPLTGLTTEEVRSRLAATSLFREFETGLIEPEPFAEEIMRVLGFRCSAPEFERIWTAIFTRDVLIPDAAIAKLVGRYRLVIVSNTNLLHFEMLRREYGVFQYFDEFVLSYKVHAMKPAPAFYEAAIAAAQCRAGECVFIDDLAENVAGARLAGMDGIEFRSFAQLQQDLGERGILLKAE